MNQENVKRQLDQELDSDREAPQQAARHYLGQFVSVEEHACRLQRSISGSQLIRLEGTGHQIPQTRPESVVEAIERVSSLGS